LDPWKLIATEPSGGRLYLANGYMSTALSWAGGILFESEASPCYIRGVYNDSGPGTIDRLVSVPSWSQIRYGAPARVRDYRRELDLRRGVLKTSFTLEEDRGTVWIDQTILVSRADRHQAAIQMVIRTDFDGDITMYAGLDALVAEDIETLDAGAGGEAIWLYGLTRKYRIQLALALTFPEERWTWEDSVGQNIVTRALHTAVQAGEEIVLTQLVRVATSLESDDSLALVLEETAGFEGIRTEHERAWDRLWETDVELEGDPEVQQFVRAALFYLWSSVREGDDWSIAPMGLSSNGYNGHIFWDAELWMYPSLLVTQPEMARSCVAYRERTLQPARVRAVSNGCRGAQFPWEGAFTGEEMTPTWAETRDFQLHITADVAIGQWWYFLNTGDLDWLRDHGFPVIRECAEFWVSRVEYDENLDRYEISDVVCADEYAAHVDNNAFTNAAVRLCLLIASRAGALLEEHVPEEWPTIARKIYIPYDEQAGRHLEFDGYDGRITKQADVELLAYPLEYITDGEQIARDLDYYATVIDPHGPAMSFSIYSIVSAQLDRAEDAYAYFKRSYEPNTRPPFQSFSETPTNNEFLFCTGIGGALQALLYGFTGLRLYRGYFALDPLLPERWSRLSLHNLFILGARTDIEIRRVGEGVGEQLLLIVRRKLAEGAISLTVSQVDGRVDVAFQDTRGAHAAPMRLELVDSQGRVLSRTSVAPDDRVTLPDGSPDRDGEGVRERHLQERSLQRRTLRLVPEAGGTALHVRLP